MAIPNSVNHGRPVPADVKVSMQPTGAKSDNKSGGEVQRGQYQGKPNSERT